MGNNNNNNNNSCDNVLYTYTPEKELSFDEVTKIKRIRHVCARYLDFNDQPIENERRQDGFLTWMDHVRKIAVYCPYCSSKYYIAVKKLREYFPQLTINDFLYFPCLKCYEDGTHEKAIVHDSVYKDDEYPHEVCNECRRLLKKRW